MLRVEKIYTAPPNSGDVVLGQTLPSLLDDACNNALNDRAFNQWTESGWRSLSNQDFRETGETVAFGLVDLGLKRSDRVAFLMHSDLNFCIVDMGCLMAGLVNVPIDLTQTLEHIIVVLQHSEARALIVSNLDLFKQIMPYITTDSRLEYVVIADVSDDWQQQRLSLSAAFQTASTPFSSLTNAAPESVCLDIPMLLHPVHSDHLHLQIPQKIQIFSLDEIQIRGQNTDHGKQLLRDTLTPDQLATIVYIPDEAGQLEGVMLTHESLSGNALASFSGIPTLGKGSQEVVLSFLPLNHVLARVMIYGHIYYGHSIYFSTPNRVTKHFKDVQPTILTTVPLLLEKVYSRILEKGTKRSSRASGTQPHAAMESLNYMSPLPHLRFSIAVTVFLRLIKSVWQWIHVSLTQLIVNLALRLAKRYPLGRSPTILYRLLLKLADWVVLSKWRAVFGERLRYVICGGAALDAELARVFTAAGVPILHGYGLTQASAVVCCNRASFNRAGTVGVPIAGVEVAISADREILIRGPYITQGYYKNPLATQELIDRQGWLHTGDLGEFTDEGFLKITGLKKSLFKLSTGKYIAPQPIENQLKQSAFISEAIAIGAERKFCALLIIPNLEALHHHVQHIGLNLTNEALLKHPYVLALYQALVNTANCHLPYWATVKRFQLINAHLTLENGLLKSTGHVDRATVNTVFANQINALYQDAETRKDRTIENDSSILDYPLIPESSCPTVAQSLISRW